MSPPRRLHFSDGVCGPHTHAVLKRGTAHRALVAILVFPRPGAACTSSATPVHHGTLVVRPAVGRIDRGAGLGSFTIKGWTRALAGQSNGVCPDSEPVLITLGTGQQSWRLEPGMLKASRHGRAWTFRNRRPASPTRCPKVSHSRATGRNLLDRLLPARRRSRWAQHGRFRLSAFRRDPWRR